MDRGGVQRTISLLTQQWAGSHGVTVATFSPAPSAYPHGGELVCLDPGGGFLERARRRWRKFRRIPKLRAWLKTQSPAEFGDDAEFDRLMKRSSGAAFESERELEKFRLVHRSLILQELLEDRRPDAVFAFMDPANVVAIAACETADGDRKKIVSVWNNPRFMRETLRPFLSSFYRRADEIVANSGGILRALIEEFGLPADGCRWIPNPVDLAMVTRRKSEEIRSDVGTWMEEAPTFLAVGRLFPQKGFDRLLDAFSRVEQDRACRLLIAGEGPDRRALEERAASLGLADHVRMPGALENPFPCYDRAAAFVLSSRYEGSPNVVLEAMACGCPVISFDCDYGPAELIEPERTGLLVREGDVEGLAGAMMRVLNDPDLARLMAQAARLRMEEFRVERIAAAWLERIQ